MSRDDVESRYELRPLTTADADELARLHIRVWRETYAGLMPAEKLEALDPGEGAARWRAWLGAPNPPRVLGAIERSSRVIVGWICVGEPRDEDAPAPVELWVLNLDAAHHGTGLAHVLLERELGDRPAYLWVVDGNARAQAFYRKHGFELDGVGKEDASGTFDLRMVRG